MAAQKVVRQPFFDIGKGVCDLDIALQRMENRVMGVGLRVKKMDGRR